jgi:hypothetical protein
MAYDHCGLMASFPNLKSVLMSGIVRVTEFVMSSPPFISGFRNFESKFSLNTVKNDDRYEIGRRMDSIAKDLSTHKDIFLERKIKPFQLRFIPNNKTDAIRVYDVNFSASPAVKINKDAK